MALYTYGGTPADVLTTATGDVVPDYPLIVRRAGTGELVTALYEIDGATPISELRSNAASSSQPGAIRPFKVDGVTAIDYEYLDASSNPVRWYQAGREVAANALDTAASALAEVDGKLDVDTPDPQSVAGPVTFESPVTFDEPISAPNLHDQSAARWFVVTGAVGNGIADDLPAIQAQLNAARDAGGGIVVIPPGYTYAVTSFLVVYANTTIWAYGARIISIHATTGLLRNFLGTDVYNGFGGQSHIKILGGTWDCNAYSAALGTGVVTATTNTLCFIHCEDITVRDCRLVDSSSAHALEFNAVKGAVVEACRFEGFIDNSGDGSRLSSEAIQIDIAKSGSSSIGAFDGTPCVNVRISGCYFGPSARLGAFGRAVGSHAEVATKYFDDITIESCVVEGALETGIHGWNWRRARIVGNTIRNTATAGIYVSVPDPAGGTVYSSYGITIADNHVEGAQADSGIRVIGYDTAQITDVVITGNTIRGAAGSTANGIQSQCTPGARIANNMIDTVLSTGIFPQYSDAVAVTGNTVKASSSNGINIAGCSAATVVGNTIDSTSTNHGIVVGGGSDGRTGPDALVANNRIRAAAVAGIRVSQTGCHITGNKVTKSGGSTVNGVSLVAGATGCVIIGNDLSGNNWATAAAILTSGAAPITGPGSMQALPGSNIVDTDLTAQNALEAAMCPAGRYETTSRLRAGTASTPVSGVLYLVPIWLPKGYVVNNIAFTSGGTAAVTPTNQWFTLHDSARVALARTADATTAAWAANTTKQLAIAQTTAGAASSYTTTYSGLHYVGFMVAASTVPNIVGEGSLPTALATVSPGFGPTNSGQTTPPTVTAAAFTAAAFNGGGIAAYGSVG